MHHHFMPAPHPHIVFLIVIVVIIIIIIIIGHPRLGKGGYFPRIMRHMGVVC
jgi:hypothetical protein